MLAITCLSPRLLVIVPKVASQGPNPDVAVPARYAV